MREQITEGCFSGMILTVLSPEYELVRNTSVRDRGFELRDFVSGTQNLYADLLSRSSRTPSVCGRRGGQACARWPKRDTLLPGTSVNCKVAPSTTPTMRRRAAGGSQRRRHEVSAKAGPGGVLSTGPPLTATPSAKYNDSNRPTISVPTSPTSSTRTPIPST